MDRRVFLSGGFLRQRCGRWGNKNHNRCHLCLDLAGAIVCSLQLESDSVWGIFPLRVLFVVPNVPSFVRPRPLNFIRGLSRSHKVSVLCVATNESDDCLASDLQQYCHDLEVIRLSRWESLWNCLVALFCGRSLRHAYFYSRDLRNRVKAKIDKKEVDLIHAEHLKSVPMVRGAIGKVPAVFDAVDCVSMFEMRRRKVLRNPLFKLFSWMEWTRIVRGEVNASRLFNRMLISSRQDKDCYPASGPLTKRLEVIPNGVDLEHFRPGKYEPQNNLIVFCAKLDYFANQDAALYFSQSVWPLLRARRPELRFEIVGSSPPRRVRQLDGKDNISVIASVADVRPHLGRAWVALCPIRAQAGIQNKVLEAMALGVPIVASRICCRGLAIEAGKHLLVADTPEEFVRAVELLLDNQTLRDNLIRAGRTYVERHHDWAGCIKNLCDVYVKAEADFAGHVESGNGSTSLLFPRR